MNYEQKGLEKGIERGIGLGEAKLIRMMLNNGTNINIISKQTGLSVDQINKLIS